jgi:predicted RNA binding protein with dsRBD fold (UPF0201 family)
LPNENKVTRPRLSKSELHAITLLISEHLKNNKASNNLSEQAFLKKLRRKLERNIKDNSFIFAPKKQLVYVTSYPKITYTPEGIKRTWLDKEHWIDSEVIA